MVTELGYKRRTYDEILNAKIAKAKELFGEEINTEENTPLGKYIRINAYDQYNVEEIAEKIYYSINPQTAFGQSLDNLGWIVGIKRNIATPARYKVTVTGSAGATIKYGFLVGTETELNFYNTEETTIGENGTCEIIVECIEAGTIGNIIPSDINKVVNPVYYVDTVKGSAVVELATDEESDSDFVKRFEVVREGKGGCTKDSIIAALTSLPTVKGAYINVNESATETIDGVPPKTIACYIDGGENKAQEIGETIFEKKPIGIGTYGDNSVFVSYGNLENYEVKFSFVEKVQVYVNLEITTNEKFEANGNSQIQANIASFINDLEIGKPLIVTALYSQIYSVTGVEMANVKVSTDGANYNTNNIEVESYRKCSLAKITINGVEL